MREPHGAVHDAVGTGDDPVADAAAQGARHARRGRRRAQPEPRGRLVRLTRRRTAGGLAGRPPARPHPGAGGAVEGPERLTASSPSRTVGWAPQRDDHVERARDEHPFTLVEIGGDALRSEPRGLDAPVRERHRHVDVAHTVQIPRSHLEDDRLPLSEHRGSLAHPPSSGVRGTPGCRPLAGC